MNKRNIIIIVSILAFIAIAGGISYSYFVYNKSVGDVTLSAGEISISLSGVSGNQTISNAIPMPDSDGKASSNCFDFTVNSTVDTERIYYEVYLLPNNGNTLDTSYLKTYLTDQFDNEIKGVTIYNSLGDSEIENGKVIYKGIIEVNQNGTAKTETKNFRLRLWLDESFAGQTSKTFDFDIYLYAKNVDDDFKLPLESCPDCKYIYHVADLNNSTTLLYTTWNMAGDDGGNPAPETPSVITSGLYDDYEELISTTGKNHFLGVRLNNQNQVTNVYACGVKNDVPFCIEGTSDGSKYNDNQTLLQGANLYNNTCTVTVDHTDCGSGASSGSISANAFVSGDVNVWIDEDYACGVSSTGFFACVEPSS